MRHLKTALTVIGAVTVLILAANSVAVAATGHSFILGKSNSANKATTLSRTTSGTVLSLHSKSSSNAPLTVNGRGRVTNLNADLLDGYDSAALRPSTYVFKKAVSTPTTSFLVTLNLAAGSYVVGYSAYLPNGGLNGATSSCDFIILHSSIPVGFYAEAQQVTQTGMTPSLTGSDALTVTPGDQVEFGCYAPNAFTTNAGRPISMYATRTNVIGGGSLRAAP